MKLLFADTGYWIALLNPKDDLHEKALEVSQLHQPFRTITSEWVLAELLNYFAKQGEPLRQAASQTVDSLRSDPNTEIVPAISIGFREAHDLYRGRPDKAWSLTDCSSIRIMEGMQITQILAHDVHFEQAGFETLLR